MNLIVFGAQGYALGTYKAIEELTTLRSSLRLPHIQHSPLTHPEHIDRDNMDEKVDEDDRITHIMPYFLVSERSYNEKTLAGIAVRELREVSAELSTPDKQNTLIIISTPENVQPEIEEILEVHGFHNYSRLTSERWSELMKMYHYKAGRFLPLSALPVGCSKPFVRIYAAKSHVDRALRHPPTFREDVFPIQVGRANADRTIADIVDNTGENISIKNGNYSELTGLYWLWKNRLWKSQADESGIYYGFGQYRRMLTFTDDDFLRLTLNDIDAVLPYPLPYDPNIHAHHARYVQDSDWEGLLAALRELEPEYSEYLDEVLNQEWLYNYNVILAKKSVLRDYCSWLFSILARVEDLTNAENRSDRYLGYLAETLETLYFLKNKENLNIAHTACEMYS